MPRFQDAIPGNPQRAWQRRANPVFIDPLHLAPESSVRTNPEKEGLPFVELINFSDCEGVIGPKVAAKLAKDFADYEDRASAFAAKFKDDFFLALYREWRRAFEWAADGGMVHFN